MVNRRYLRIKVMQALFAHTINPDESLSKAEKKLTESIQNYYKLFLYFFSIFPELKRYQLNKFEERKAKINPTEADLNPNTKFTDNILISQIEDNPTLKAAWTNQKIHWTNQNDIVVQIFQEIAQTDIYQSYMNNKEHSYQEDKNLLLNLIEKVFVESTLIHWFFEEQNLHWFDDYNDVLLAVYQNISRFEADKEGHQTIFPLFKHDDDKQFYLNLFRKTWLNDEDYFEKIISKILNWEPDRIMTLDMVLLKMAICELIECPTIPIKVTVNEYIELAKTYSSSKSGFFINGIIDKIIIDLKDEGKLNKIGRGLFNE